MVNWKLYIDSPQQRALDSCGGSLTTGSGYGCGEVAYDYSYGRSDRGDKNIPGAPSSWGDGYGRGNGDGWGAGHDWGLAGDGGGGSANKW